MAEIGFLGVGGLALDQHDMQDVAIGSTVPPEYGQGAPEHLPKTATTLAIVAGIYLLIFVFHVVTF